MAPKKSSLKSLPKKGVSSRKANQVKGGQSTTGDKGGKGGGRLAANHSQTLRAL